MNPKQIPDGKEVVNKEISILTNKTQEFKDRFPFSEVYIMIPEMTSLIQHIDSTTLDDNTLK